MPQSHRHSDLRTCGATTVVVGQQTVFVNDLLWAVQADPNNHEGGALINSGTTVFIQDKPVIVHAPDDALPDDLCLLFGPPHCEPKTAQGSPSVYAY